MNLSTVWLRACELVSVGFIVRRNWQMLGVVAAMPDSHFYRVMYYLLVQEQAARMWANILEFYLLSFDFVWSKRSDGCSSSHSITVWH